MSLVYQKGAKNESKWGFCIWLTCIIEFGIFEKYEWNGVLRMHN